MGMYTPPSGQKVVNYQVPVTRTSPVSSPLSTPLIHTIYIGPPHKILPPSLAAIARAHSSTPNTAYPLAPRHEWDRRQQMHHVLDCMATAYLGIPGSSALYYVLGTAGSGGSTPLSTQKKRKRAQVLAHHQASGSKSIGAQQLERSSRATANYSSHPRPTRHVAPRTGHKVLPSTAQLVLRTACSESTPFFESRRQPGVLLPAMKMVRASTQTHA